MIKKILAILLFAGCIGSAYAAQHNSAGHAVNGIAAFVNDGIITNSVLESKMSIARSQMLAAHAAVPDNKKFRQAILDQLIDRTLMLQYAQKSNITVTDEDVDNAAKHIAAQNHLTMDKFKDALHHQGLNLTEFKKNLKDEIMIQKFQGRELGGNISVTKKDINEISASLNKQLSATSSEYHLKDMVVEVTDMKNAVDVSKAKSTAEKILNAVKNGSTFEDIAKNKSKFGKNVKVNDLDWRKISEVPQVFVEKIITMEKSQIAGPIVTDNGFHILKLAGKRNITSAGQNISMPSKEELKEMAFRKKINDASQKLLKQIREQSYIKVN